MPICFVLGFNLVIPVIFCKLHIVAENKLIQSSDHDEVVFPRNIISLKDVDFFHCAFRLSAHAITEASLLRIGLSICISLLGNTN